MSAFWQGKKTVILGGAGFLGSHLAEALDQVGADVWIVDDFSRGNNRQPNARYLHCDILSEQEPLTEYLKGTFAVFNLAAKVAGVTYNQSHHLEMFKENLDLQAIPLQAAQAACVPHYLHVSSVCVYGQNANYPAIEGRLGSEPTAANDGYSWGKRMGEKVALWSGLEHLVIVRPSNLYGPRDYFDDKAHVIPALIKKALSKNDPVTIYGTGEEVREFLYVTDAANGMMAALEKGRHREAYNLGTDGKTAVKISELWHWILQCTHREKAAKYSTHYDPGDSTRWSDCTKIQGLGWRYETPLRQGLQDTVDWYRKKIGE